MAWLKKLGLSTLLMVTGCGGCDSCFGNGATVDASSPTPTASVSVAPKTADAGPAEDAATESDAGPVDSGKIAIPVMSALPRPKAPMPMGAFQTCGVYDGPLCEKTCLKGACRQECDGIACELSCQGGYCSQLCGATGKCKLSCAGGHCTQACTSPDGCTKTCTGGDCQ